jgi:hypothetical protein
MKLKNISVAKLFIYSYVSSVFINILADGNYIESRWKHFFFWCGLLALVVLDLARDFQTRALKKHLSKMKQR